MSYLVLARKYRPQSFQDVVRQEHVTRTLANAIASGRVAHAILFSGPRGTGKTTIARILAKSMNCQQGPAPAPCNDCRSCREITAGNAVDVFEIDGASNNGVDHIRELRENIKYMPAHSRYKIYIIDEVHMLSTPAFNALLKTLEEPPAHVLFFFATTEPHKIPVTILSRCQRHDLRRIDLKDVTDHLAALCRKEEITVAPETLEMIAREAGGSMRDALSLLDQVMTCTEGNVTHEQVRDILGVVDRQVLFTLSESVLAGDLPTILATIDAVYSRGHNLRTLYAALMEHFRNLLVVRMGHKAVPLDVPAAEIEQMAAQVNGVSETRLSQMLDILFREEASIRLSSQPRLALEMTFIRMLRVRPALPIDQLIEKLDELSRGVFDVPVDDAYDKVIPSPSPGVREPVSYRKAVIPAPPREDPPPPREPAAAAGAGPAERVAEEAVPDTNPAAVPPEQPSPARKAAPASPGYDPNAPVEVTWSALTEMVADRSEALRSCLGQCRLQEIGDSRVAIAVNGNGFHYKRVQKNRDMLRDICNQFFGRKMELVIEAGAAGKARETAQKKALHASQLREEAINHPMVAAAIEIFEGKLVDVKVLQEDAT